MTKRATRRTPRTARAPAAKNKRRARPAYGTPPPGAELTGLHGLLVVVEGQDSSGRSTHVGLLSKWLQREGYAVVETGLRRSDLVAPELDEARRGNTMSPRTMSLFYATDFYDQLENRIIPALRSGAVVLADRYIFTLMARDLVRGADPAWVENLYAKALVPDALFYLQASARTLLDRHLEVNPDLDYWESGMDLGLSRDWHESFLKYQRRMRVEFDRMLPRFNCTPIHANRSVAVVHRELQKHLLNVLRAWQAEAPNP